MFRLLFFIFPLLVGCAASYEAVELKKIAQPASQDVDHVRKEGLCIVAKEFDSRDSKNFFSKDVRAEGYIPVYVNLENLGERSFKIKSNAIVGVTESGDEYKSEKTDEVIQACAFSHSRTIPLWIIIIPGAFLALNVHESVDVSNELMERDYKEKSFKSVVLKPKDTRDGVLFFKSIAGSFDHIMLDIQQLGKTEQEFTKSLKIRVPVQ